MLATTKTASASGVSSSMGLELPLLASLPMLEKSSSETGCAVRPSVPRSPAGRLSGGLSESRETRSSVLILHPGYGNHRV